MPDSTSSNKPCFTPEQHEEFWALYAERIQPAVERASRSASRRLTGNGMNPDDMAAWIDDRIWALQRSGRWPFFHDSPEPAGAIERLEASVATLVRWAYLALSRKHCSQITENKAARGLWWRAPLTFLSFHFLRHFPAIAGSLPAHTPRLEPLVPEEEPEEPSGIPALEQQEKAL